jgi:hypothetical protein
MLILLLGGVCEVYVEVGSRAMIYILSFIRIGLGFQKLFWEGEYTHT